MKTHIDVPDIEIARLLLGPNDSHCRILRERLNVRISLRHNRLVLEGDAMHLHTATTTLERMIASIDPEKGFLTEEFQWLLAGAGDSVDATPNAVVIPGGNRIDPKGPGQTEYLASIRANDLTFATGPAGTGKTYLAVACAVEALKLGRVRRIILCRPAVEAGEKLGFLPGDMQDKVNPYLRPLYDSLDDMLTRAVMTNYMETGVIEVAPLAFMRGRTLHRAFVIMDEAQNTTPAQMKMFLTRLGPHSKAVVTGDETQTDLDPGKPSGLLHAREILNNIPGIAFVRLTPEDIVRHRLVRDIVRAYEADGVMT